MKARKSGSKRSRRTFMALVAALAAMFSPLALAGAAMAAAAPPATYTPEQKSEAIAQPSVVYLTVKWRGYVQLPAGHYPLDGHVLTSGGGWTGPFKVTTLCSGFVASPDGYVVTAGHCIDNQSMTSGGKAVIIDAFVTFISTRFGLPESEAAAFRQHVEAVGKVEGRASGSGPDRTVKVYLPGQSSGTLAAATDFTPLDKGDVGLVKVDSATPLPTLTVAAQTPPTGTSIIMAGYPGSVTELVGTPQHPSFKGGETSSEQNVNGVPFTEVSAAASAGMSGGPALNMQGQVVGTVSFKPGSETQAFNFITSPATIRSLLARNGVQNRLGSADTAYREGLAEFWVRHYHAAVSKFDQVLAANPDHTGAREFRQLAVSYYPYEAKTVNVWMWVGIGAGVLVLLGAGTAFLLIRRRRKAPPVPAGPPAAGPLPPAPPPPPAVPAGGPPAYPRVPTSGPPPAPPVVPTVPAGGPPPAPPAYPTVPTAGPPAAVPVVPASPEVLAAQKPPAETAGQAEPAAQAPVEQAGQAPGAAYCPNCGTPHAADARFCASCGERFTVMTPQQHQWNGRPEQS